MKKTDINLVPDIENPTPDYYCTWQTQLFATCDGKPAAQRRVICEKSLFDTEKPYGWAYFYEKARADLILVMDDSWDVGLDNNEDYYGSLVLSEDKFPSFTRDGKDGLKSLTDRIKSLGWKGLGGWICAQESPAFSEGVTVEEYWAQRLRAMDEAGFSYWKVDWGKRAESIEFRRMLTDLARILAPNLTIEHAIAKDILPYSDVFRTYDVNAIMSIPMTIEKIVDLSANTKAIGKNKGLINCEDEAYIAAAGGFAMGIMRHPYAGDFADGRADMSFPKVHRNLKTKMYEVIRAARFHRLAPAFGGGSYNVSENILYDSWKFENKEEEMEEGWFYAPMMRDYMVDDVATKYAPSAISRNIDLPHVLPDTEGRMPYCVASRNPNGVCSIVTLGRTLGRSYFIPKCDVTLKTRDADTVGVFGEYESLTLETELDFTRVLMQDIAADTAFDVTEQISFGNGKITVPGELISEIGTSEQPEGDTSEPGVILKLIK